MDSDPSTAWLMASMPLSSVCQPKPKTSASTSPANPLTMGTKRRPPKNAR